MRGQTIPDENQEKKKPSKSSQDDEDLSLDMAKSEFSEQFPALHYEIFEEKQSQTLKIDEVQSTAKIAEKDDQTSNKTESEDRFKISDPLDNYSPSVEDFIARADTDEEAFSIIDYLRARNEISPEKANEFETIIRQKGVRALGPKRTPGYYDRFARDERARRQMERRSIQEEKSKK
ncbi:MAG: DUF2095 family protein [Candidatus Hodarchaeales archaeon]|jgi:hypothetical protein